jgi:hypothetical protein
MITEYLDGKKVAKMPLRTAQAVASSLRKQGYDVIELYEFKILLLQSPQLKLN